MLVSQQIEKRIKELPKGSLIFISDFSGEFEYEITRKVLQRLYQRKELIRIMRGIYYLPKESKLLGTVYPSVEQIAEAIAKRDKARIIPTGSYALNQLGLSTQVPMNVVYLTDGSARKIEFGKQKITLKKISPKNLAITHKLSNLIIQSLRELGEKGVTSKIEEKIRIIIERSGESELVKKNIINAPVWIQKIVLRLIKE